ncbi:MAG: hypothetical protein EXR58_05715 [Chloroflexi bacterium]|nr:hypothetical protein [Chloroflexota bacterium]
MVIDSSTNPSTVYAAQGITSGHSTNGVWKTTTNLSNTSGNWTKLPGSGSNLFPTSASVSGAGRIRLAVAQATLYAVVHRVDDSALMGAWKTIDGGTNWTQTTHPETSSGTTGSSICSQCWYDLDIAVFPTDPNIVYVLGVEAFRSTDGGSSWAQISNGYTAPYKVHVDQHAIGFIPGNASGFYLGNDGGMYKSLDAGANFTNLNATLQTTQFYRGSAHPMSSSEVDDTLSGGWRRGRDELSVLVALKPS